MKANKLLSAAAAAAVWQPELGPNSFWTLDSLIAISIR
jgi:hypothetical protein